MTSASAGAVLPEHADNQPGVPRRAWLRARPADLLLLIPAAAELAVGGWKLGSPSLWRDESDTLSAATRPVSGILALIRHQDAVHGPYYLVMHYVLAVLGTSPAATRLPSLLATAAAAGCTAAVSRRVAAASGLPAPAVTGMTAGLLLVALPRMTWYAQDARPYAMATLLAVAATYLLIRGWDDGRARWWAGYGVAVLLLGAMNLLAAVILLPHAITMLTLRRPAAGPGQAGPGRRAWAGFLAAAAGAVLCLIPLAVASARQSKQIGWIRRPGLGAVLRLLSDFAGVNVLVPVMFGLVALCIVAEAIRWRAPGCTVAKIALPWLVLPPAVLIGISLVHAPVYNERYVMFCAPAMAMLAAGGLAWLACLAAPMLPAPWLALAAPVLIAAVITGLLIVPQQNIRLTGARTDDLAKVASILSAHERPGDAVLYVPWAARLTSQAYPAPFAGLAISGC